VPEPADPATPARPPRPRRAKKFVLPEHHRDEQDDERTAEHIEAFLDGPVNPVRQPKGPERVRRPLALDTRQDWMAALHQEGARHARYGRPVSVVLFALRVRHDSRTLDRTARTLADVICAQGRETDRAVRIDAHGFRLLLPETGIRAARTLAERLERAFLTMPGGNPDAVQLCVEVTTAQRTRTLEDALTDAETRLAARTDSI
jgi:GGDEF domain-containing protein